MLNFAHFLPLFVAMLVHRPRFAWRAFRALESRYRVRASKASAVAFDGLSCNPESIDVESCGAPSPESGAGGEDGGDGSGDPDPAAYATSGVSA